MEEWRAVVGDPRYEVSNLGRVRSYRRSAQGRILRPGIASHGYPTVALGRGHTRTVHSLVAEAFIGSVPAGQEVRHKNGIRNDPRASNLHYGTRTQNITDAITSGTWLSPKRKQHLKKFQRAGSAPGVRQKAWATRRANTCTR